MPTFSGFILSQRSDGLLLAALRLCAVASAGVLLLIALFLLAESGQGLTNIGPERLLFDEAWYPAPDASNGQFKLLPMLVGTVAAALGALLLATPLGVFSAVFCHNIAPTFVATAYRRVLGVLAGIPSVVFGFWGLVVLVPLIGQFEPPGASLLAGILILTLMIVPTVALLSDAALDALPRSYAQGAAALGLGPWATATRVLLPAARGGVATGVMLAAARALGETMAVLMVCGNVVRVPDSVFDPVRTLTANIALEMAYAADDHRAALFVSGLLLTVLVSVLVLLAHRLDAEPAHA